jgi:hypothetical protein
MGSVTRYKRYNAQEPSSGNERPMLMKSFGGIRGFLRLVAPTVVVLTSIFIASPTLADTASPPSIESESVSNITPTDATLGAEINLHEAPAGVYYQFQLVTDPSEYASEILCPPTLEPGYSGCIGPQGSGALPIGFLPGNTLQPGATLTAGLDLANAGVTLQPGTTYHYRVLAARAVQTEDTIEWEPPTAYGADQTFTTPPAAPPSIEGESVSNVTQTGATLEAQINPGDAPAGVYYQFQLVSDPNEYSSEIICPPEPSSGPFLPCIGTHSPDVLPIGFVPPGSEPSSVNLDLASAGVTLHPRTTYHYRVLAARAVLTEDTIEWEPPPVSGADQTFTTPPYPPPTTDPQLGGTAQPAIQAPLLSHPRRHHRRHHRKHNRGLLHRGKVLRASVAG